MTQPDPDPPEERWTRLLTGLGCTTAECRRTFAEVALHYRSPGRHYHTLDHILDVLGTVELLRGGACGPALRLAAWLHDVVYDPRAGDNEEQSAAFARALLGPPRLAETLLAETGRLILLTRSHQADPADLDGQALLDADLAILGAEPPAYDRYALAIRAEYAWVPEADYRAGRRRVLESFLRRPRIYATEALFARLEARARANLERERASLGS